MANKNSTQTLYFPSGTLYDDFESYVAAGSAANIGAAGLSALLSLALFFYKRTRHDPPRNAILLCITICSIVTSSIHLGVVRASYSITLPFPYGPPYLFDNRYFPSTANKQLIALTFPSKSVTFLLTFLVSRCTVRLLYRPDLPAQTKVYRTIAITIYTVWTALTIIGLAGLISWVTVQGFGIASASSGSSSLWGNAEGLDAAFEMLAFVYFLFISVFSAVITWDKRFDMRAVVLFQFALICFMAGKVFEGVWDTIFNPTSGLDSNNYRGGAVFTMEHQYSSVIFGHVLNIGVWLLLGCFFRDYTRRTPRKVVPGWRERAFGSDSDESELEKKKKLDETPEDIERAEMDSKDAAITEAQSRELLEAGGESKVAGELLGCPRAELHGRHEEVPSELPGDVEIAELPAGKDGEDAAYVKATKGYDSGVIHSALERAQQDSSEGEQPIEQVKNPEEMKDPKDTRQMPKQTAILGTRAFSYER